MNKKFTIFVIMPFDVELNDFYTHIKELIQNDYFEVYRADDLLNQQNILKDIVISIHTADMILADLTGSNPNVYYELGLAHALRKNVILLTQDITDLPFDLRSYRVIEYSTHFARIKAFNDRLINLIAEFDAGKLTFGSPVTDWIPQNSQNISQSIEQGKTLVRTNEDIQIVEPNDNREEVMEVRGFIDFLADLEESTEMLTDLVNNFALKTDEVGKSLDSKTDLINVAVKSGSTVQIRKVARGVGELLHTYGKYISEQNQEYQRTWNLLDDSLSNLVNSPLAISTPENIEGFKSFLDNINTMKGDMMTALIGISSMAEGVTGLIGMESSITRAASLINREVKNFEGLIDKSISTLDRIIHVGQNNLETNKDRIIDIS